MSMVAEIWDAFTDPILDGPGETVTHIRMSLVALIVATGSSMSWSAVSAAPSSCTANVPAFVTARLESVMSIGSGFAALTARSVSPESSHKIAVPEIEASTSPSVYSVPPPMPAESVMISIGRGFAADAGSIVSPVSSHMITRPSIVVSVVPSS